MEIEKLTARPSRNKVTPFIGSYYMDTYPEGQETAFISFETAIMAEGESTGFLVGS
jgi:hypothetical protein